MSKPDEITLWVTRGGNGERRLWAGEPTSELIGDVVFWTGNYTYTYIPTPECWVDPSSGIFEMLFDGLEPGEKRPVTLKVTLGKAVKG